MNVSDDGSYWYLSSLQYAQHSSVSEIMAQVMVLGTKALSKALETERYLLSIKALEMQVSSSSFNQFSIHYSLVSHSVLFLSSTQNKFTSF